MGELSEQVNVLRIIRSRFFIIGKGKCKYGKVEGKNKPWVVGFERQELVCIPSLRYRDMGVDVCVCMHVCDYRHIYFLALSVERA